MPQPVPAVGVLLIQADALLLIRRGHPPDQGKWSLPGGRLEWGETLTEAARREIREETGLDVSIGEMAGVVDLIIREGDTVAFHYVILNYFATITAGTPRPGDDADAVQWVPLARLPEWDVSPSLRDFLRQRQLIP